MRFVSTHALIPESLAVAALLCASCKSNLANELRASRDAGRVATTSTPTTVTTGGDDSGPAMSTPALTSTNSSSAATTTGAPSASVTPSNSAPVSSPIASSVGTVRPEPFVLEAGAGGATDTTSLNEAGMLGPLPTEAGAPDPFDIDASDRLGVVLLAMKPLPGSVDAARTTDIELLFDEPMTAGEGALSLTSADGLSFETVPLLDPRVTIDGKRVRVDFDGILAGNTEYTLSIEANALLGQEQTPFAGLTLADAKNFTTEELVGPGDVEDGLVLWFDASNPLSLRADDTGVSLWADASGNRHDLAQPLDAARPRVVSEGLLQGAAVRFDGTDDVLQTAQQVELAAFDGFVVWQARDVASTTAKAAVFWNGASFEATHGHPREVARDAVSARVVTGDTGAWYAASYLGFEVESAQLWNFSLDVASNALSARTLGGGAMAAVVNDVGPSQPEGTLNPPGNVFTLGNDATNTAPLAADISELILFSRVLDAEERQSIVEYLKAKWSIAFTPCDAGSEEGAVSWSGRCVYVRSNTSTWTVGQSSCRDLGDGWDLATPRSAAENAFVTGLLYAAGRGNGWIGGSDRETEGSWSWANDEASFWSEGSTESYSNWSGGAPASSAENADCLAVLASSNAADGSVGDGRWTDRDCTTPRVAVCEGPVQ